MSDATLPEVKSAQISYLDYICEIWQIRRDGRVLDRVDVNDVKSDIYTRSADDERRQVFARHRAMWPY